MKKILGGWMLILTLVFFTGCGGGGSDAPDDSAATTISEDGNTTGDETSAEENLSGKEVAQLIEEAYGLDQSGLAQEEALVHLITHVPLKRGETRVADEESADPFGGDKQAYWDGSKMVADENPCAYFYEPGRRGTIKENSGFENHWDYFQINYPDVSPDYNVTYLNFCSSGIYDVTLWNINIQPDDWVRYNTMAQFHFTQENGKILVYIGKFYNENWDGTDTSRDVYRIDSYLWISGEDGEYIYNNLLPDHWVKKYFVKEYEMPDGTILDNCLVGEFTTITRGLRENNEAGGVKVTTIIHLGGDHGLPDEVSKYFKETEQAGRGVVYMDFEPVDVE